MSRRKVDLKELAPAAKVPLILERLGEPKEVPAHCRPLPPMDSLVLSLLSQHTTDANADWALEQLKTRYGTWEKVLAAPRPEVADAIRAGGLAEVKSGRVQAVLQRIKDDRGKLDLAFLRDLPAEEARAYLVSLPGIGKKTAAVILLFQLGMPFFPIDVHVQRVSTRLGLLPNKITLDKAHDRLDALLKPEQMAPLHVALVMHGRQTCTAQRPKCGECALAELCPQVGLAAAEEPAPAKRPRAKKDQ